MLIRVIGICIFAILITSCTSSADAGKQVSCPTGAELAGTVGVEQWCQVFQETEPPYYNHGWYKKWHPNGKLAVQGTFNQGLRSGEWLFWNDMGEKISTELWESGKLINIEKHNILEVDSKYSGKNSGKYQDNRKHGKWVEYDQAGKIIK